MLDKYRTYEYHQLSVEELCLALLQEILGDSDIFPEQIQEYYLSSLARYVRDPRYRDSNRDSIKNAHKKAIEDLRRKKLIEILGPGRPFFGEIESYASDLDRLIFDNNHETIRQIHVELILRQYQKNQVPPGLKFLYPRRLGEDNRNVLAWDETLMSALKRDREDFAKLGLTPEMAGVRLLAILQANKAGKRLLKKGVKVRTTGWLGYEECPFPNCPQHKPLGSYYEFADDSFYLEYRDDEVSAHAILWHMLVVHGLCRTKEGRVEPEILAKLIF